LRLTFLLDENVLYHAVRGVNEHDEPNFSAMEFLKEVARICHQFSAPHLMYEKYFGIVQKLKSDPPSSTAALRFVIQLLSNSSKLIYEPQGVPELPEGIRIPHEDIDVVRAALASRSIVVAADSELRDAINNQPVLNLRALTPKQAIDLARSESPQL